MIRSLYIALALACSVVPVRAEPIDIHSRRELFVDYLLIASMTNATLTLQTPTDEGPALWFNEPWEGKFSIYASLIREGPVYRMYYRGNPGFNALPSYTCYAESTNGIDWVKPRLGFFLLGGTTNNNVVVTTDPGVRAFAPFIDRKPGVPASERYKAISMAESRLAGFTSPDGVHWTKTYDPILSGFAFDSHNVAFYSEAEEKYVCYFRDWQGGIRRVRRAVSDDFATFTDEGLMGYQYDGPPLPLEHHYISGTHPHFRAPHLYVALAARFIPGAGGEVTADQVAELGIDSSYYNVAKDDASYAIFMTARPGALVYDRPFPGQYITPGDDIGPQMARSNYPGWQTVQTGPREMSFYVDHNYASISNHLRRYSLRLDGYAAVSVTHGVGEMTTEALRFSGHQLRLNYLVRSNGTVRVEIRDTNGVPVTGYALTDATAMTGDEIDGIVSWHDGSSVAPLADSPIQLRFVMENADLFAMQFVPVISNTAPTSVLQTSARLNGGMIGPTTTVGVAWGPAQSATNGLWSQTVDLGEQAPGSLTFPATNLTADTRYAYTFFTTNAEGVAWAAPPEVFPTAFAANDAPSGLTTTHTGTTRVELAWTDNSASEVGFRLERSTNGVDWTLDQQATTDTTNAVSSGLSPSTVYDFRVRAFSELHTSAFSNTSRVQTAAMSVSQILIDGVPNPDFMAEGTNAMRFWLDADDPATIQATGGVVTNWTDKSLNGLDAWIVTVSRRPVHNATAGANGRGQIAFDGVDDYLIVSDPLPDDTSLTVFFALDRTGNTTHRGGLFQRRRSSPYNGFTLGQGNPDGWGASVGDTGGDQANVLATAVTGPQLWAAIVDFTPAPGTTTMCLYRDGELQGSHAVTTVDNIAYTGTGSATFYLMCRDGISFQRGNVYEVLTYTTALSDANHNAVGYYLQQKYAIDGAYVAPADPDADGDGIPDAWEEQYGGTNLFFTGGDFDGDDLTDDAERVAGTVPTNNTSTFRIAAISQGGDRVLLFDGVSGRTYRAEWSTNLLGTNWWHLPGTSVTAVAHGEFSIADTNEAPRRFYRLSVEAP